MPEKKQTTKASNGSAEGVANARSPLGLPLIFKYITIHTLFIQSGIRMEMN